MSSIGPVLVTGSNGFIAYHIIAKILEEDPTCDIHSIDINTTRNRHPNPNRIIYMARPVTIFHTASPEFSDVPESAYRDIIVDGTTHLLSTAMQLSTVRAIINTSTCGVINDNHTDLIDATETLPIPPPVQKRLYCIVKADAEDAIQAANRNGGHDNRGILTCAIRPGLVFGERDIGTLGKMVAVARQGKSRFQIGNGRNPYDFVYVGNLAAAHILAARALLDAWGKPPPVEVGGDGDGDGNSDTPPRVDGECFHITNEDSWLFWDFQREVSSLVGNPVASGDIVVIPKWAGLLLGFVNEWAAWVTGRGAANMTREGIRFSTLTRTLNGEKARRVLGYRSKVGMREGLERSVRWFMEDKMEEL